MSCNCGKDHIHGPIMPPKPHMWYGNDCNSVNRVFAPGKTAFNGTPNHFYGCDIQMRTSLVNPGVMSGLYRECGPLNCSCCGAGIVKSLVGVDTQAMIVLAVTFNYSNCQFNETIEIIPGNIYTMEYVEDGCMNKITGLVKTIYRVNTLDEETNIYKIMVDCSSNYTNNVVVISTDQLRGCRKFVKYAEEETKISVATHNYGTTIANTIENAVVINAELDSNHNIIKGTIVEGTITDGRTSDGVCYGKNQNDHEITLIHATSIGGSITGGFILNGVVKDGDVTGEENGNTGFVTHGKIKGTIGNVVIVNTRVSGSYTTGESGDVIDPTMYNSIVVNAMITDTDPNNQMITTGGITAGNVTTGGTTTGGAGHGGTAYGNINGESFTIIGGVTKSSSGSTLTTTGGTVVGGKITGGKQIGNVVYGATIIGGTVTGGITTNGDTSADAGGEIIPGNSSKEFPILAASVYNPDSDKQKPNKPLGYSNDNLLLMTDKYEHGFYTNLGTAFIQGIDDHSPNNNKE